MTPKPHPPMRRNIPIITLDGDDTLWDFDAAMRRALGVVLEVMRGRIHEPVLHELTVEAMVSIRDEVAEESRGSGKTLEEIRRTAFVRTLRLVGCRDMWLADELNALYHRTRLKAVELYPDVLPALDRLGRLGRVGILSNGNTFPEKVGLEGRLDFALFAEDIGVEKPDPRAFEAVCRRTGCRPDAIVHVGDSLASDVAGALAAGATSVWLNRAGVPNTTDIRPDVEIVSLDALPDIVIARRRRRAGSGGAP